MLFYIFLHGQDFLPICTLAYALKTNSVKKTLNYFSFTVNKFQGINNDSARAKTGGGPIKRSFSIKVISFELTVFLFISYKLI